MNRKLLPSGSGRLKIDKKQLVGKAFFLSPAMLLIAVGFFLPLVLLFTISLYKGVPGTGLIDTTVLTFDNFAKMFEPYYLKVLLRTFRIAIYTSVLSLVLGYPVAMVMSRTRSNRVKNLLLALILTPLITNVTARTLGLMIIFASSGPVNNFIASLGLGRVKFVGTELGIVLGLTQVFMPYLVLSVKSVLDNVDYDLEEAARDLGCSRLTSFFKVIFPLSMPGIVAGSLFVFLLSFSSFVTPRLMGGGKVMTITMLIYQQSMTILDFPFAAVAAMVLLLFSLILITVYNRMTSRIERMSDRSGSFREADFNSVWYRMIRRIKDAFYDLYAGVARRFKRDRTRLASAFMLKRQRVLAVLSRAAGIGFVVFVLFFIVLPLIIVVISAFSGDKMFITFPPSSYSFQWIKSVFLKTEYALSFWLSIKVAVFCTAVSLIIGILAALGLTRFKFRSVDLLKTFFLSPLTLPAVIVGIALLRFSIILGWVGDNKSLLLAHIMLATAYVIRMVLSSLVGFDLSLEEAARDLGASQFYTFRKITFPIIKPGIVVAGLFAFIVSMDETTISRFIVRGGNITLPVRIFAQLEYGLDQTVTAISCLLVTLSMVVLFIIDRTVGINKFQI
ncbi:MAG: ABC transporter permease subunit [Fastidiosipila sp.]|jgi:putative spermidine/putrescine transport system permease protein|nr:ABC transporter permease subunit [Fastidiosipila sp.]